MAKRYCWILLASLCFMLTACSQTSNAGPDNEESREATKAEENEKSDDVENEESGVKNGKGTDDHKPGESADKEPKRSGDEIKEMSDKEAGEILTVTITEVNRIMKQVQEDNMEWFEQDWAYDQESNDKEFQEAMSVVRGELSAVMTNNALDQLAEMYTRIYFCSCDAYTVLSEQDTLIRAQIEDHSADQFIITSLSVGDNLHPEGGWTNEWSFKKEHDVWKLNSHERIDIDTKPLNLTFGDLQHGFLNENGMVTEVKLVDEIEMDGEPYIVIEWPTHNGQGAYNIKDGSYRFLEKGMTNEEEHMEENVTYNTYTNDRFGFSLQYPDGLTMSAPPTNGDGANFYNEELDIKAYAGYHSTVQQETIESHYQEAINSITGEIAYKRLKDDWYVISYIENGDIIYTKTFFGDHIFNSLIITHPASAQGKYEPVTEHVSKTFNPSPTSYR